MAINLKLYLELLFLLIGESGSASGTFLPNKTVDVVVVFVECCSPLVDAADGDTHDFFVVVTFENHLSALQARDGLNG